MDRILRKEISWISPEIKGACRLATGTCRGAIRSLFPLDSRAVTFPSLVEKIEMSGEKNFDVSHNRQQIFGTSIGNLARIIISFSYAFQNCSMTSKMGSGLF